MIQFVSQKCDNYFKEHLEGMVNAYKTEQDYQLLLKSRQSTFALPPECKSFE